MLNCGGVAFIRSPQLGDVGGQPADLVGLLVVDCRHREDLCLEAVYLVPRCRHRVLVLRRRTLNGVVCLA